MHDHSPLRHTISLQPAWERSVAGRRGWSRRFGRPLDLPPGERLVLVIAPGADAGPDSVPPIATLNGTALTALPAAVSLAAPAGGTNLASDVTGALTARNELHLAFGGATPEDRSGDGTRRHRPLPVAVARVWLEVHAAPDDGAGATDHP